MFHWPTEKPRPKPSLEERVVRAAEAALADHKYVSIVDVLIGIQFLHASHVEFWRKGGTPYLEQEMQGSPEKRAHVLQIFRRWAETHGLEAIQGEYLARTLDAHPLQFSPSGDAEVESVYRTHYVSPHLSEKKKERLSEKLREAPELVVFLIARDSQCSDCKTELPKGSFLLMEGGKPLCLACADLDHLVFLPRGDTALTRRARKHSSLSAVVVQFSRTRRRYERQGLLVEDVALRQAEEECLSDEELRARRREQDALRRQRDDLELVESMALKIKQMFPGCPSAEAHAIAEHAAARGSGRVGRSAQGRSLDENALRLAVIASIRHKHTDYDDLIMQGMERAEARAEVRAQIDEILAAWEEGRRESE